MAIPNSGRFAAQSIQRKLITAKADNPGKLIVAVLVLTALAGDKSLKFTGKVEIVNKTDGVTLATYDMAANSSGGVQKFADVDSAVKIMAGVISPAPDGDYGVTVKTGVVLAKAPAADLVKANATEKARLQDQAITVNASIAKVDAQLALMDGWESGNPLQAAKKAEETAKKAALVALVADITTRIGEL